MEDKCILGTTNGVDPFFLGFCDCRPVTSLWFGCLELNLAGLTAYLLIEEPPPQAPPGLGAGWVHLPPASSVPLEPHSLETPMKAPTEVLLGTSDCDVTHVNVRH